MDAGATQPAVSDSSTETPATSDDSSTETPATSGDTSTETPAAKPIEVTPIEVAEEVKPGEPQVIETAAGDVTVTVAADDEALAGTTVNISNSSDVAAVNTAIEAVVPATADDAVKAEVKKAVDAVASGDAFMLDISFTKDDAAVQPGKPVSITVPVPADLADAAKLFVYHVSADGLELVESSVNDGKLTLTSDKFSPFIISKTALTEATNDNSEPTPGGSDESGNGDNNGNGGDQQPTGIALAVAPVVLAAGAVVAFAVKKRK
ncbi:MAG: hypothetical protein K2J80_09435 [Oscillospiraceae bacterium]|nr:hypothetical protein [Oscillospiraceae bacterium]